MKKFKKLIAVVLTVILSLSVMSVVAFASTTDSLKRTDDGTWLYMENGEHNADYTGLVKYYDTWYYVENGVLNWNYTGPTEYYGTTYYVIKGILEWDYSSLVYVDDVWHYVHRFPYRAKYRHPFA